MDLRIRPADSYDVEELAKLVLAQSSSKDYASELRKTIKGLCMMIGSSEERTIIVAEKSGTLAGAISGQLLISVREGGLAALVEDLTPERSHHPENLKLKLLSSIQSWARSLGASRILFLSGKMDEIGDAALSRAGWYKAPLEARRYQGSAKSVQP